MPIKNVIEPSPKFSDHHHSIHIYYTELKLLIDGFSEQQIGDDDILELDFFIHLLELRENKTTKKFKYKCIYIHTSIYLHLVLTYENATKKKNSKLSL